jgi:hypothetical protein
MRVTQHGVRLADKLPRFGTSLMYENGRASPFVVERRQPWRDRRGFNCEKFPGRKGPYTRR